MEPSTRLTSFNASASRRTAGIARQVGRLRLVGQVRRPADEHPDQEQQQPECRSQKDERGGAPAPVATGSIRGALRHPSSWPRIACRRRDGALQTTIAHPIEHGMSPHHHDTLR